MLIGGGEERADNSRVSHSSQKACEMLLFLLSGQVTALIPQLYFSTILVHFYAYDCHKHYCKESIFYIENPGQEYHKDCGPVSCS